jgi:ubiquitin-conjugating enzyme E2 S
MLLEGTPFAGGKFKLKLVLSADYPNTPPKGFFLTKIYHPNVAPNGDICVNTLKKDWNSSVTLGHVFQVIRCLLIVPFPESSLNDEAGKLFMDSYDEFARRAKLMTNVHALEATGDVKSCGIESSAKSDTVSSGSEKIKKAKEAKKKSLKRL